MKKQSVGRKRIWVDVLCITALVFSCFFAVFRLFGSGTRLPAGKLTELRYGWYRMEAGQQIPVSPGEEVPFDSNGTVTLYIPVYSEGTVTTRSALYRVEICMNGMQIYCFDDSAFPCNEQMRAKIHCDADIPNLGGSGLLSITYYQYDEPVMNMPPVYFGTSGAVLLDHITSEAFTLILVALMLLCAIAAATVFVYLAVNQMMDRRFLDMMIFLLLCCVWCLCDSGLARYFTRMSPGVEGISFYAFMTLGIPFAQLVADTLTVDSRDRIRVITWLFCLNAIVQTILWATGMAEFIEMLPATHVFLTLGIITCVAELYLEYRKNGGRQTAIILLAFSVVGLSGTLALLLYWLFRISFYGIIFEAGILSFLILLMGYLCSELADSLRFKTELRVYERLSREDSMTGLQNRRGFDAYIQTLMNFREQDANAELLFLDINGLKEVNDRYGHRAGDEMIIGAAQCLKDTFGPEAACFRLGGDEFCVVIPGGEADRTQWKERLRKTVDRYNQNHRIRVSMAVGSSMLLDENGKPRSLSDWKQQADQQMYQEKKKMKLGER